MSSASLKLMMASNAFQFNVLHKSLIPSTEASGFTSPYPSSCSFTSPSSFPSASAFSHLLPYLAPFFLLSWRVNQGFGNFQKSVKCWPRLNGVCYMRCAHSWPGPTQASLPNSATPCRSPLCPLPSYLCALCPRFTCHFIKPAMNCAQSFDCGYAYV